MSSAHWLRTLTNRLHARQFRAGHWIDHKVRQCVPRLERLEDRLAPAVITVIGTGDDAGQLVQTGANTFTDTTLRGAIARVNSDTTPDTINFNIAQSGVQTIYLNSQLPTIMQPVVIDGTTEAGWQANTSSTLYNATLTVVLDGSNAGASEALLIAGGNSTVKGLQIQNLVNGGIHLLTNGNDTVLGCSVQNTGGFYDSPNDPDNGGGAVYIEGSAENTIGGTTPDSQNEFTNTSLDAYISPAGVQIAGTAASNNQVLGNFIGTDGSQALDQGFNWDILIFNASDNTIGGTVSGSKNVIGDSGNAAGIQILGASANASDNVIQGNFIGTDATGSYAIPNPYGLNAIQLDGYVSNTLIGGPMAAARNVISAAYGGWGIGIQAEYDAIAPPNSVAGTVIQGNYIGLDAAGTAGFTNAPPGGTGIGYGNASVVGDVKIIGNVISGWSEAGINMPASTIQGNLIGTDSSGLHPVPNGTGIVAGSVAWITGRITVDGKNGDLIGGTAAGEGNTIAFNSGDGVVIEDTGTQIEGNSIYGTGRSP